MGRCGEVGGGMSRCEEAWEDVRLDGYSRVKAERQRAGYMAQHRFKGQYD